MAVSQTKAPSVKIPNQKPLKTPDKPPLNHDSLHKIQNTKLQILEIKQCLNALVDQLHQQKSYLTRSAHFWGEVPLWVKVIGGLLLFGAILAIGIWIKIPAMIAVACVGAVVYGATSTLLDDHYTVDKKSRALMKANLNKLADMLGHIIVLLQQLCEQLANEIDRLKQEINRLNTEVNRLTTSIDALETKIKLLTQQVDQFTVNNIELTKTKNELAALNLELVTQVNELTLLITTMKLQMQELESANSTFKEMLAILANQLKANEASQKLFVEQFNRLLSDTKGDLGKILSQLYNSQQELAGVKAELMECNHIYKGLLQEHQQLLKRNTHLQQRLEKILSSSALHHKATLKPSTRSKPLTSNANPPKPFKLFSSLLQSKNKPREASVKTPSFNP